MAHMIQAALQTIVVHIPDFSDWSYSEINHRLIIVKHQSRLRTDPLYDVYLDGQRISRETRERVRDYIGTIQPHWVEGPAT